METDASLLGWLVAFCILVVIGVFFYFVYSGLFTPVKIQTGTPPIGSMTIAYKFQRGPYSGVAPILAECTNLAPDAKQVSMFYDNTTEVADYKCRYVGGVVVEEGMDVAALEAVGFKTHELPAVDKAVYTKFPSCSALTSYLGLLRVYPALQKYLSDHDLLEPYPPTLEVSCDGSTTYLLPLYKHDSFLVPEASERFDDTADSPSESEAPRSGDEADERSDDEKDKEVMKEGVQEVVKEVVEEVLTEELKEEIQEEVAEPAKEE
ncbi:testis-expressed protein 264-like [Oratosquilla oratoria]|uniref:testis-expressed protein 264-like n=1 Tax=Oratosquilla oratoria TaxID=337810 RepID=UPI003F76662D